MLGAVLMLLWFPPPSRRAAGPPARGYVTGATLIIEDGHGVELWRRRLEGGLLAREYVDENGFPGATGKLQFADIDADGTVGVLFVQRHADRGHSDNLFCFSA